MYQYIVVFLKYIVGHVRSEDVEMKACVAALFEGTIL